MATFTAATKNPSAFPTRAPAQSRVGVFVAITCSDPNDSCDLYSDDCRTHAQLVSPSKDPIGYVGGLNIYAYVLLRPLHTLDPLGLIPPDHTDPRKDPHSRWPYVPGGPLGPKTPPQDPFRSLPGTLDAMCANCCDSQYCECAGDGNAMRKILDDVWRKHWGNGPLYPNKGAGDDSVGGYYCTEWANFFHDSLSFTSWDSTCFAFDRMQAFKTDGSGKMHAWVRITVGKGGPGCEINIDDGWGNGVMLIRVNR